MVVSIKTKGWLVANDLLATYKLKAPNDRGKVKDIHSHIIRLKLNRYDKDIQHGHLPRLHQS